MRVLDRRDVEELLDPDALVDAVAEAMVDLSLGQASLPPRIAARVPGAGLLATMPAYSPRLGVLATKLLTVYRDNEAHGFPVHQAAIAVFDPATGEMLALVKRRPPHRGTDRRVLRAVDPAPRPTRVAGARRPRERPPGARARPVRLPGPRLHRRPHRRPRPRQGGRPRRGPRGEGLPARGTTIDDAVAGADVVCAATSTVEPLLRRADVRPGTHVASVGYVPDGREVDAAILREALVVVEHRETCLQPFPAGSNDLAELVAAGELDPDGVVEIGELVDGRRPGREDEDRVTVFKSVGVAVQDAAAASVVLAAARRDGRGVDVSL